MQHLSDEQHLLTEWTKEQPISVYQLDPADRVVLKIADERDAIQKKTFTKWVNKHLKKAGKTVNDLFEDLQDGHNLLSLLEVLSGELLVRERGRMRFHKVQNCNAGLQFLRYRKIKVVNIRPEDIVDGNPKLTLGLIWTIILHFQISVNLAQSQDESTRQHAEINAREARNALLVWVRDNIKGYPGVSCKDFSKSWRDGLTFNALLHRYRPNLIDFRAARQRTNRENLEIAFGIAEKEFNCTRLLDPEDVDTPEPDDKSIITYVSSLYDVLNGIQPQLEQMREARTNAYVDQAVSLHSWMTQTISRMHKKYESSSVRETQSLIAECALFRSDEIPRRLELKNQLSELFYELENLYINATSIPVKEEIQPATLDKLWRLMLQAIEQREQSLHDDVKRCERLHPKAEATCRSVLIIENRLNSLRDQMKQDEQRIRTLKNPYEAKNICDSYDGQLREIDISIRTTMTDARSLKDARYYDAETIYRSVLEVEQKYITVRRFYEEGIVAQIAGKTFTSEERLVTKRTERISSTRLVDHREQGEDSSQSDETGSYGSDGSYSNSAGISGFRMDANGMPVVQIQSYMDRSSNGGAPNPNYASHWQQGKEMATAAGPGLPSAVHGSRLLHGRNPGDEQIVPNVPGGSRRRSSSQLEATLNSDGLKRTNEPRSEGANARNAPGQYYFGAAAANGDSTPQSSTPQSRSRTDSNQTHISTYEYGRRPSEDRSGDSVASGDSRRGSSDVLRGRGVNGTTTKVDSGIGSSPYSTVHSSTQMVVDSHAVPTQTNGTAMTDAGVQYAPPVDLAAALRKARADSLKEKANKVLAQLETFNNELVGLEERCHDFDTWTTQFAVHLQNAEPVSFSRVESVQEAVVLHATLQKQISAKGTDLSSLRKDVDDARAQSKGLTSLLNENRAHMDTTPPPIYAKSNEVSSLFTNVAGNFDKLSSESIATQQNLQCLADLLTAYDAHLDEAAAWIKSHEKQIAEARSLPNDKAGLEMAKLRFEELERRTGEFQKEMDRLSGISGDILRRSDGKADEIRAKQDMVKGQWDGLKKACDERMKELDSVSFFLHSCDQMHGWLLQKHKMISVLGPVSYDAALLEHQKQQVDVLLDELRTQRAQINRLHDEAGHLLGQTKEAERNNLLSKLNNVEDLWTDLHNQLETRGRQIENAAFAGQVFTDSFQTLQSWLDGIAASYESFVQVDDVSNAQQQLGELQKIDKELNSKAYLIGNTENAATTLREVLNNEVIASEIESKLQNARRQYGDLKKRNEALKNGLERNLKQGQEFDLAYEEMSQWLANISDRVRPDVQVSALVEVVTHQMEAFDDVRQEIAQKEYQVHAITLQGKELITKAPSAVSAATQSRLESVQSQWQDLNKRSSDRHALFLNALDLARRYKVAVDVFVPWLAKSENDVASFQPILFKKDDNGKQLEEVIALQSDIRAHSGDYEAVQQQGTALLAACQTDTQIVRDEMAEVQTRWDDVNQKTMKRARSLEDVNHRLTEYDEAMDGLKEALVRCEDKLKQADESQFDQKTMDKIVALKDEVESMKRQIDYVEDFGHGLLADGEAGESDVSHIEEELVAVRTRYHDLENSIGDTIEFLEKATADVGRFVEELKQTENYVNELEDELDNMAPQGKDLETLANQMDEMERYVGNIDVTAKEVHDVEEALDELVDNGYAHHPEPWREQIENLKDQLANLVVRADNRETELKLASEKLEEFHNTLSSVMQSLSQGEDGEDSGFAPNAGTDQIHQQFFHKLDGILHSLNTTADKLANCEPISALPGKLQKQMEENNKLISDLAKRSTAYESAKRAAGELARLAQNNPDDEEAVGNIKDKLSNLDDMWGTILKETENRGRSLENTYKISVKFWKELGDVTALIKEFESVLHSQEPPAVEVNYIRKQQDALQELKEEFNQTTQPDYEQCVSTGQELMVHCGEPDKPEVKKNMEDLDHAWGNITQLFMQRDTDLVEAMEKSMAFHGLLQSLIVFLEEAEDKLTGMGSIGAETEAVKRQMEQLKVFRAEMEPHTVDVESLIAQADELVMKTSEQQAQIVQGPVEEIRERWDSLCDQINERKKELEEALVHLGQFRHALDELVAWIMEKEKGLDEYTIPSGDPKMIELELAKHKVLLNDLIANERTLDILNEAGTRIIEESEGGDDAKATMELLDDMNLKWQQLLQKAEVKQTFLEDHLKEAESFQDEIQDLLNWLTEKDQHLIASRPVGGLQQTAKDQLATFMELYNDLDANKSTVETMLKRGGEYLEMAPEASSISLDHNLKTLKHRWEAALTKANDRKIKLEIAVRDAVEFYDSLQTFTLWLTNAEKGLASAKPPSRVMDNVLAQIEEHKVFQEDLSNHLNLQNALDKKGTTLKYFSQKQDVVQIKNLLASVQQRWDKLVSASADRQRSLNTAYTEGKEFNKHFAEMTEWIDSAEKQLDGQTQLPTEVEKIKAQLAKHREFQKVMTGKQAALNGISKMGRILKESAAKSEQAVIGTMLLDLQKKWKTLGTKSAERQRKLEEALLFSGQLKDALHSMLEWLSKMQPLLLEDTSVHGDLDNVKVLDEQHKALENDLSSRAPNISNVQKAARDFISSAADPDPVMQNQLSELEKKWKTVTDLSASRRDKLDDALRCAFEFHQLLHSLIEWLGATEMKIRVFKALPDDVKDVQMAIFEIHEQQSEMQARQANLDAALDLGSEIQSKCHPDSVPTMRHWLKVLTTRWQEVDVLMKQREQRLKDHAASLEKSAEELDQLLVWFFSAEANLVAAQSETLPEDLDTLKKQISEHQEFESALYDKQMTVERLTQTRPALEKENFAERDKKGRKTTSARKPGEPIFASNGARDLFARNKNVVNLALERRDRLQEQMQHLIEMEKLQNFQFDDWRRRFVRFMNVKKLRVMDFFRRLDKDADGRLTRDEFIDCILKSTFHTTPLEMEIVADIFDQNKDGFVDYPEFVHALKPDWRSTQNLTDADKIEDEMTFQVQNCTCKHHYQVQHVGEGRYIFGESQKLRLVRILRSTVMVRVGGGWIALDEFLVKNDPCRAKGRTNIELREQFILPEGASQSMTAFKSKTSNASTPIQSNVGPITKIREKSVHTTPWRAGSRKQSLETSSDPTGSSPSPYQRQHLMPHSHTHQQLLTPHFANGRGKPTSRPSTAAGSSQPPSQRTSRPPSRAGSEVPEDQPSSNSAHSRSSSISSMSNPGVSNGKTVPQNGTKTTGKINGNPRKR